MAHTVLYKGRPLSDLTRRELEAALTRYIKREEAIRLSKERNRNSG